MSNPLQQAAGYTFNSNPSGILGTVAQIGTCTIATSTALTAMTFNPQTTGPSTNLQKGSLMILGSGGHAPDILASVTNSSAVVILTATSSSASLVSLKAFNFPALISGEASAVTNTNTLLSSYFVGNAVTGGVVNQIDCSNALYGDVVFISGGAFTPTAGGYIAGWFLESDDSGTSFEKNVSNTAVPRAPDFTIPTYAAAYAAGDRSWAKGIIIPSTPFKTIIQNQTGATMPSTWGIWLIPEGMALSA